MAKLLDYESRPQATPVRVSGWTWLLAAATVPLWLASLIPNVVGDSSSPGQGAIILPGFVVACCAFPWWPVNVVLALMPLTIRQVARQGAEAADTFLRWWLIALGATSLLIGLSLMGLRPSDYGAAVPLWLAAHVPGSLAIWRLARVDAFRA